MKVNKTQHYDVANNVSLYSNAQQAEILTKKETERIRRRDNQRRYRKRQNDLILQLEKRTQHLRIEIEKLKRERGFVSTAVPVHSNLWSLVARYFRLFRHGLQNEASSTKHCIQLNFVLTTMKQDLQFNTAYGTDALMRHWMCISLRFKDFKVKLLELKKEVGGSMVATTMTSITITERTLRSVFPHLCRNGGELIEEDTRPLFELGNQLLGSQITMNGSTRFFWDKKSTQVTSITSMSDMLTPMLKLLGSLEDVSRVFEKATISPDFQWKMKT
ncbi:hypothetical protein PHMEG_00029714 [Phytophthora megakarya]|uniref:Bzip transcription factor n=1 Tax=Phytophthora megakarya TaxID=4795 RepID=A0A225V2D8_9STRA|nr:hypothetical protein PHMEG_00029714 [Phytophthora megakarya]